jgi:hypothetical protein
MTHKFGLTPFPLTVTRTSRLSKKRPHVEVSASESVAAPAHTEDPTRDQNTDAPDAEDDNA